MTRTRSWLTALMAAAFVIVAECLPAASPGAFAPWWNAKWKYRQVIEVVNPQLADQINTAIVHLDESVAQACLPDGRDIRIVNEALDIIPHQVTISAPSSEGTVDGTAENKAKPPHSVDSPGKASSAQTQTGGNSPQSTVPRITVEFLVSSSTSNLYYLYYGNPDAPAIKHDWKKKKGSLTLTTGKSPGGNATSMKEMIAYATHAQQPGNLFGSGDVAQINHEDNPFGPDNYYVSIYKGTLFCPESGEYGFATDSDDASFLLIDGKVVAEYPHWGRGHVRGEWADTGEITLKSGIHQITYYHVEYHGGQLAQAAWKKPSDKTFEIIPPEAFVRELRTRPVASEEYKSVINAFFIAEEQGALRINGGEPQLATVAFRSISSASLDRIVSYKWDFGDGNTSSDPNPVHEYKKIGTYAVRLSVKDQLGYEDTYQRDIEVRGKNAHKMSFAFEAEPDKVVLYPNEDLKLALAFAASAAGDVEVSLRSRVTTPGSLLADEAEEAFTLRPSKWRVIEKTFRPELALPSARGNSPPEMTVSFALSYHGVTVASKTVKVIDSARSFAGLAEKNGMFVDQQGCITVLRSGVSKATKKRWRLESWQESILAGARRASDQLRIAIYDDVLCAPGERFAPRAEGGREGGRPNSLGEPLALRGRAGQPTSTAPATLVAGTANRPDDADQKGDAYFTIIARRLESALSSREICDGAVVAKEVPRIKIRRIGGRSNAASPKTGNGGESHFLARIIDATREICSFDPHLVLISCSARDILQHTPPDKFERALSAAIDNILANTAARVVLVSPPPLALAPDASRPYALAMKRLALDAGIPAVDIYSAFLLFPSGTKAVAPKGDLASHHPAESQVVAAHKPAWLQLYQREPLPTAAIEADPPTMRRSQTIDSDVIELYPGSKAQILIAERIYQDGICDRPTEAEGD